MAVFVFAASELARGTAVKLNNGVSLRVGPQHCTTKRQPTISSQTQVALKRWRCARSQELPWKHRLSTGTRYLCAEYR